MIQLPFPYLACLYAAGGIMLAHAALFMFGYGATPGQYRDPIGRGGANAIYDLIVSSYVLVVGLLAYGLVGLLGTLRGADPTSVRNLAAALAVVAFAVGLALQQLSRRVQSWSDAGRIKAMVGLSAVVTTSVPVEGQGKGIVQLIVKMRATEFPAVTAGNEIPTGTKVRIHAIASPGVLEVVPEVDFGQIWQSFTAKDVSASSTTPSLPSGPGNAVKRDAQS